MNLQYFTQQLMAVLPQTLLYVKEHIEKGALTLDHVCYRTETQKEYEDVCNMLLQHGTLEGGRAHQVSGRSISTIRLNTPLTIDGHDVIYIEVPAPKEGRPYKSGFEHVELTLSSLFSLDDYIAHASFPFSTQGKAVAHHPHITMKVDSPLKLKINTISLVDKIAEEVQ